MTGALAVKRHFVTIPHGRFGARQVHYLRAGRGPCLLLFHQSPLSSRDLLPTIEKWQHHFTCIAPDTPGYGLSDPFGVDEVEMDDIADGTIEFADALGIGSFGAYGFHTGAMIAAALAVRFPERVTGTVADGYLVPSEATRADLVAHYLPGFEPRWDGSHLVWLWARLREQRIFFPWYRSQLANRLDFDVATPEALQSAVVDFLRAGDNYRVAYRAAFTFRSDLALERVPGPMLVTANKSDPLHADLDHIHRHGPDVEVRRDAGLGETPARCRDFLQRHPAPEPPPPPPVAPLAGSMWQQWVDLPDGQVRVRRNTDASGRVVVILHGAVGSSDTVAALSRSFIGRRPVLAIDLPGHGESDRVPAPAEVTVERQAAAVRQVLDALGIGEVDVCGFSGGGLIGLQMCLEEPTRVRHLVLGSVPWFDAALRDELLAEAARPIEVDWYGGHLLQCWHTARDRGLFQPGYRRDRQGILWQPPRIDPVSVQERVTEMFKAPEACRAATRAHLGYPLQERLPLAVAPILVCAPEWDPHLAHTREAARANGYCRLLELPDSAADWGRALLPFLDSPDPSSTNMPRNVPG